MNTMHVRGNHSVLVMTNSWALDLAKVYFWKFVNLFRRQPAEPLPELDDCAICLEPILHTQPRDLLDCGHLFHMWCAEHLYNTSSICPVCRSEIIGSKVIIPAGWTNRS